MPPADQAPTREVDTGPMGGTIEHHPAYAVIGASRVSSSHGEYLFGSDFRHHHYVLIRIGRSSLRRDLSHDWIHGDSHEYIEVALSEAQWATFVSSMNVGGGVPCTLSHLDGTLMPGIAEVANRSEQFKDELADTLGRARPALDKLEERLASAKMTPTARDDLKKLIDIVRQNIGGNVGYVAKQFGKHMERTVERAKIEVNAYVQQIIIRAGVGALRGDSPIQLGPVDAPQLGEGDEE